MIHSSLSFRSPRLWVGLLVLLLGGISGAWYWHRLVDSGSGPRAVEAAARDLKNADGSWKYTNGLAHETSPYLLLHAHNPVDWLPWGAEAIARARREDKPIFLSVGYSTCYWCHVMERLVFSDPDIAALMNEHFVNIKVDREERPDIDRIYMTATQLITGGGGWPNSVFLTPALEPFFAGTYFPPYDAHGRPGFPRVLGKLHEAWEQDRSEIERIAAQLTAAIREAEAGQQAPPMDPDSVLVERALAAVKGRYDALDGGFGGAPKFPPPMRLEFLMARPHRTRDAGTMQIVSHTLEAMARGGIYDQVGGGFHRYATDAEWKIPHFEKMLYNQAHLARLYTRAYAVSGEARWRRVAEGIFAYVQREMTAPDGAFYSALDAETEAEEGLYYLWTEEEIHQILGAEAALFFEVYALEPMPEGGGGVLYVETPVEAVAEAEGMALQTLLDNEGKWRALLLAHRQQRTYPLRDDKVLTSWNGMMIAAYAYAYQVLGDEQYRRAAERAAAFALKHLQTPDGGLVRVWRNGEARGNGYLEDYACLARGLLSLHRATGESRWLEEGHRIVDAMVERFWDAEAGGFFFTEVGTELLVRSKSAHDSALPSANAVAVHSLLDLARWTGLDQYREVAGQTLRAFGGMMRAQPAGFVHLVEAAERYLAGEEGPPLPWPALAAAEDSTSAASLVQARTELHPLQPEPGALFRVDVHLQIRDGWHINAHPASAEGLIPTSLTLNANLPLEIIGVHYPRAESLYSAAADDTLAVYQGRVTLQAHMRLPEQQTAGHQGELRLILQYQACDTWHCLPPAEIFKRVPLQIAEAVRR